MPQVIPTADGIIYGKNGSMELRVCPECDRAFYSLRGSDVVACLHCGFVLLDRRGALRTKKEAKGTIALEGEDIPIKLIDYSLDGLKIICKGRDIKTDMFLDIDIEALGIHKAAKTVWSKKGSGSLSSVGLKLL